MRIYLAGAPGGGKMGNCKRERELNNIWTKRLWSYYHLNIKSNENIPSRRSNHN
jgi:broad-specificity NMP kinase